MKLFSCPAYKLTFVFLYRYRTQYPILGLLYDDYEYIPPGSDTKTIVIEKREDKWTCVSSWDISRVYNY